MIFIKKSWMELWFYRKTSWIPGPAPFINVPTKLDLVSKIIKHNVTSFTFNVTGNSVTFRKKKESIYKFVALLKKNLLFPGPDHIGIIISPYKDVHLEKWSISNKEPLKGPTWNGRETYFVYYACASDCTPYTFSIELNVSPLLILI